MSDGAPPKDVANEAGGVHITEVWGTESVPVVPGSSDDPTLARHQ